MRLNPFRRPAPAPALTRPAPVWSDHDRRVHAALIVAGVEVTPAHDFVEGRRLMREAGIPDPVGDGIERDVLATHG